VTEILEILGGFKGTEKDAGIPVFGQKELGVATPGFCCLFLFFWEKHKDTG
jgi:hypothetical protein